MNKKVNILDYRLLRKDHYDGMNALYRFSAVIDIKCRENSMPNEIIKMLRTLKSLDVVPNEVVVFSNRIEIHWYPKGYQMVLSYKQYLEIVRNFISYINRLDDYDLKFLKRCLTEDPDRTVWGVPNEFINFKPNFNSNCFGSLGNEIKIIFLQQRMEGVA